MKERNNERERKWKKESKNLFKLDLVLILVYYFIFFYLIENIGYVYVFNNRFFILRKGS